MDALQPADVRDALTRNHVSSRKRYSRKNRAFRRQGEWFFLPEPSVVVDEKLILRNEPLRRGAGKPHLVEQIYRTGGEEVYVTKRFPNGLTPPEYRAMLLNNPAATGWGWQVMRRKPRWRCFVQRHRFNPSKEGGPMNSASPGPTDDDHCSDTTLNLSAASLEVYRHERLAFTEIPVKKSESERRATRKAALLKAMYYWVFSR